MALAGHKHNGRLVACMVSEGRVAGTRHGLHASIQIGDVKALDVDLERYWPDSCISSSGQPRWPGQGGVGRCMLAHIGGDSSLGKFKRS